MAPTPHATTPPQNLGSFIQSRRLALGLSTRQFARLVHIHRNSIPKLEANLFNLNVKQLQSLADGLQVSLSLLYAYLLVGGTNGHRPRPQTLTASQRRLEREAAEIREDLSQHRRTPPW